MTSAFPREFVWGPIHDEQDSPLEAKRHFQLPGTYEITFE
jgi:hypothetical protein